MVILGASTMKALGLLNVFTFFPECHT